jgi:poly-gamma-glutamate capsule biosynthesis protein CapA/YwtB (metallophosphatase superfamily)
MNNERRKEINRAIGLIEEAKSILETVRDEEQEAYDNLSESLQSSERGEAMENAASELDQAIDGLDTAQTGAENAKGE